MRFHLVGQSDPGEDVDELRESATGSWETFVEALPRAAIALAVLAAFVLVGRAVRPLVESRLRRHRTPSFARVFARLTRAAFTLVGAFVAMAIVFPSVQPVDLLAGAGVLSVAVGFAFRDILQNLLAGVLLLFRQPFRGGDEISVGEFSGTVQEINVRETVIRTYDGHVVLIPNATVYTDMIDVQTGNPHVRDELRVGIAYEAQLGMAQAVVADAVRDVPGVAGEPAPEVLVAEFASSSICLDVLFWCDAHELEVRRVRSRVVRAVKEALDRQGIAIPYEIITLRERPPGESMRRDAQEGP